MTLNRDSENRTVQRGPVLLVAGGLIGALAATSCCILPVALFGLGIGGAWIGNFTQPAPYKPYFVAAAVVCLGAGYWRVWRSAKAGCAADEACAQPLRTGIVRTMLIAATLLVIAALGFDYIAPYILA